MSYFMYRSQKIFYSESGTGLPVMFLHGNAVSSRMFEPLLSLYQDHFHVILIDFLGNGRSDRIHQFPENLYVEEAKQVLALLEHLPYEKVSLVGTSGGAWAAINAGLMCPKRIYKVVADSFDGRTLGADFSKELIKERAFTSKDPRSQAFSQWCHGDDFQQVIDFDTQTLLQMDRSKIPLFQESINKVLFPLLLTGSYKDTMCRRDLPQEYQQMQLLVNDCRIHLFAQGDHPAMFTNAEEFARLIIDFICN